MLISKDKHEPCDSWLDALELTGWTCRSPGTRLRKWGTVRKRSRGQLYPLSFHLVTCVGVFLGVTGASFLLNTVRSDILGNPNSEQSWSRTCFDVMFMMIKIPVLSE